MTGIEDIYIWWHCGDEQGKISPMKLFTASDISHVKRSRANLSEVRGVVSIIDLEADKAGMTMKSAMTVDEAKKRCRVGHTGLNIQQSTADGGTRSVLHMKWSSAVRLKNPYGKTRGDSEAGETEPLETTVAVPSEKGDAPEAEETELPESEVEV